MSLDPGWLIAVSSVIGVAVATRAMLYAQRRARSAEKQLALLREESLRQAAERRQAQAHHLSIWLEFGPEALVVKVFNSSSQPFHRISYSFTGHPSLAAEATAGTQPPMDVPGEHRSLTRALTAAVARLGDDAGAREHASAHGDASAVAYVRELYEQGEIGFSYAFTDAAGVRWERGVDGALREA